MFILSTLKYFVQEAGQDSWSLALELLLAKSCFQGDKGIIIPSVEAEYCFL